MISIAEMPASLAKAVALARAVLDGTVSPEVGCDLIAEVSATIGYPQELEEFEHLAHLQHGHEQFGFSAASVESQVMEACKTLAALST